MVRIGGGSPVHCGRARRYCARESRDGHGDPLSGNRRRCELAEAWDSCDWRIWRVTPYGYHRSLGANGPCGHPCGPLPHFAFSSQTQIARSDGLPSSTQPANLRHRFGAAVTTAGAAAAAAFAFFRDARFCGRAVTTRVRIVRHRVARREAEGKPSECDSGRRQDCDELISMNDVSNSTRLTIGSPGERRLERWNRGSSRPIFLQPKCGRERGTIGGWPTLPITTPLGVN